MFVPHASEFEKKKKKAWSQLHTISSFLTNNNKNNTILEDVSVAETVS